MADKDRIEGAAKNIGGKIKEGIGNLTGDEKMKAEGKVDQIEGKAQNAVGGVKDTLKGN
ncbi:MULTISPECIES: CsbD family protein [unclassified Brevundimonas]|uniref:CsbD family protein n=1 Tax=unclassified Brevundimonas TaxID=2622653 RepID=UPI0025BEF557|nr:MULTISPECIES: CsbD family protein [unclassified Brevundimonas]